MSDTPFNSLIKKLVKDEVENKNLKALIGSTGLSKHWFYQVAKGEIKDPRCSAVFKFLRAIDHPLAESLLKHDKGETV